MMLTLEFAEDIDAIIEGIFPQNTKEALGLKKILKKALIKKAKIIKDIQKEEEINGLSQKLAELEDECDDIMQKLAFLRSRTCAELKTSYNHFVDKLNIENSLTIPEVNLDNNIDIKPYNFSELKNTLRSFEEFIVQENKEHDMTEILIDEFSSKKIKSNMSAIEMADEYFSSL